MPPAPFPVQVISVEELRVQERVLVGHASLKVALAAEGRRSGSGRCWC